MKEEGGILSVDFSQLKAAYTVEEAKAAIDERLKPYGPGCYIEFGKRRAEIFDSYKVDSSDERHLICEIIARTGVTTRDNEDLSAEWRLHNDAWHLHIGRVHAKDVSLDYAGDPHKSVALATALYDLMDRE